MGARSRNEARTEHLVSETFHSAHYMRRTEVYFYVPVPVDKERQRMTSTWMIWVGFNVFVLAMLALDLGVFHRDDHEVSGTEAAVWTVVWVVVALVFGGVVLWWRGPDVAVQYLTGYLIEKSLSADNIFIFLLIFSYFQVPAAYQHRVLFWGILGALVMRGALILVGTTLLAKFHWIIYVFGAFLAVTGVRLATQKEVASDPGSSNIVKLVRRFVPVTEQYVGNNFFVRHGGKLMATPLFVVLAIVESSDLMFAVDSVPAIFAVTTDPFIVYTSNVFAILGLRSLYFLLANIIGKLRFLKIGLALILSFVGSKMLLTSVVHVPALVSLAVIVGILSITIGASVLFPGRAVTET